MMIDVKTLAGTTLKQIPLPLQFNEPEEPVLIQRALLTFQSHQHQPYGAMYYAGIQGVSAKLSRRRRNYKGSYGHSISRAPRKTVWRRGMQFGWVGALAPGTRGGRRAHPPKPEKRWGHKLNKHERHKAVCSALNSLASHNKLLVIESQIETITKTDTLLQTLRNLGLHHELTRLTTSKMRPGKGKMRGRKHLTKRGPLLVITQKSPIISAARNIPGIETRQVRNLNVSYLRHGSQPRLTIWSEDALHKLEKENLFAH